MRCILHIGTEKTATTLIQNWLYDNYNQLSSQGVGLTRAASFPNNRKIVTYFQGGIDDYLQTRGVHSEDERQIFFEGFEQEVRDEISLLKKNHDTFILTSEHFHSRLSTIKQIQTLKSFLDSFFDEYQIICYFREQSKVRTSSYSTALKLHETKSILDFRDDVTTDSHYYNYLSFFRKWEDVFGKKSLTPRIFSKEKLQDGDIRKDFLASTLPYISTEKLDFATRSANESLSESEAVLFRTINSARPNFIGRYIDPTPNAIKRVVRNLGFIDKNESIFDPRQEDMYNRFHDVNVEFFSRYFGEQKNLFRKPAAADETEETPESADISAISQVLSDLLSEEGFIFMRREDIDFLRDLSMDLHEKKIISDSDALFLLKIANRARPKGNNILSKIDELRKKN